MTGIVLEDAPLENNVHLLKTNLIKSNLTDASLSNAKMSDKQLDFYYFTVGKFLEWIEQPGIIAPEAITTWYVHQSLLNE